MKINSIMEYFENGYWVRDILKTFQSIFKDIFEVKYLFVNL